MSDSEQETESDYDSEEEEEQRLLELKETKAKKLAKEAEIKRKLDAYNAKKAYKPLDPNTNSINYPDRRVGQLINNLPKYGSPEYIKGIQATPPEDYGLTDDSLINPYILDSSFRGDLEEEEDREVLEFSESEEEDDEDYDPSKEVKVLRNLKGATALNLQRNFRPEEITDKQLQNNQLSIENTYLNIKARQDYLDSELGDVFDPRIKANTSFRNQSIQIQDRQLQVSKEFLKTDEGADFVRNVADNGAIMTEIDKEKEAKDKFAKEKEERLRKKFNKAPLWKETAQARRQRDFEDRELVMKHNDYGIIASSVVGTSEDRFNYSMSFLGVSSEEDSEGEPDPEFTYDPNETMEQKVARADAYIKAKPNRKPEGRSAFLMEAQHTELDDYLTEIEPSAFYEASSPKFELAETDIMNSIRMGLKDPPIRDPKLPRFEGDELTEPRYNRELTEPLVGEGIESVPLPNQFPKPKGSGGIIENPNFDKERWDNYITELYNYNQAPERFKKPLDYVGDQRRHIYKETMEEVLNPIVEEPQAKVEAQPVRAESEYDDDDLSDFELDGDGLADDFAFDRPDETSRTKMGVNEKKYKGIIHLNFPKLKDSAYEFTTEGKSYGESTKTFLEQQRDAMLKMRQDKSNVKFTSMFPRDDYGNIIDQTKKGSVVPKLPKSFDPRYVEENEAKAKERAEERKAKREAQLEEEYSSDRQTFNTKRKEFNKKVVAKRAKSKERPPSPKLSKTKVFGIKRQKKKPRSPSPEPRKATLKETKLLTAKKVREKSPSPPPKKSGFRTRPARKKPPSPSPSPSPPPSPKGKDPPLPRGGKRVRGVRSDKGSNHKWSDGRENSETYKKNKAKGVDWSAVRCRASTCWKIGDRLTDKKGKGAYKENKDSGEYKEQLREKKKKKKVKLTKEQEEGWF